MNPNEALALLKEKMTEHGLSARGWTGSLDQAERRFGVCRPGRKEISISRPLCALNTDEEVCDTILHEIAHALAVIETGENCGHDERWKAICRRIGARPERCYDSDEVNSPDAPWVLAHRETGEIFSHYHKKPQHDLSQLFIRGRKKETQGQLEVLANPAFAGQPLEYFDRATILNLQQRILETLAPLGEELGIQITGGDSRFSASQASVAFSLALTPRDGLTAEQREFNQLAPAFGLTAEHYHHPLTRGGTRYRLIGFKPRNRKYPIIAENSEGTRYKLPLDAIQGL